MSLWLKNHKTELIIFFAALALQLTFLFFFFPAYNGDGKFWRSDSLEYRTLAENYLHHGVYSLDLYSPFRPAISYPPLYPLFLALSSAGTFRLIPILIMQDLLAALTAVLIYKLAKALTGENQAALIGTAIFVFEPGILFFTNQVYPEALFTFLLVLALYLFFRYLRENKLWGLAVSSGLLALATLTRPNGEYLTYIIFIFLVIFSLKRPVKIVEKIRPLAVFAFIFYLVLAPWLIRSEKLFGSPIVSSTGAYTLASRNLTSYYGWRDNLYIREAFQKVKNSLSANGVNPEAWNNYDSYYDPRLMPETTKLIFNVIRTDPVGYAKSQLQFLVPYFFGTGWSEIVKTFTGGNANPPNFRAAVFNLDLFRTIAAASGKIGLIVAILGAIIFFILYLLAFAGINSLVKKKKNVGFLIMLVIIVFYFAASTGELSYSRYRYPVDPIIFLLAGYGAVSSWAYVHRRGARVPEPVS